MVVANFGMGIRPSSSVVQTDQERQNEYQAQVAALQKRQDRLSSSLQSRAQEFARQNVQNTISLGYDLTPEMQANIIEAITPAYLGSNLSSGIGAPVPHTSNAPSPWSAQLRENGQLDQTTAQLKAMPGAFQAQNSAIASSQNAQQDAYSQFLGGFGTGGVLGSVSQAGTRDPSQPTASMPWGQPWSTPGFGNPGSLGGLGGYKPSGQQGWGSVFGGGRNPWSLA